MKVQLFKTLYVLRIDTLNQHLVHSLMNIQREGLFPFTDPFLNGTWTLGE